MDKNKDPEIKIDQISLVDCCLKDLNLTNELHYNLGIESFERKLLSDEQLIASATFDLMHQVKDPPYSLICTFIAVYTRPEGANMAWDEFKDEIIVAHILPYLREFVSSVSLRLPLPPLVLPPTNAFALVNNYRANQPQEA